MRARRNPFGIDIGDVMTWGIFGIGAYLVVSALGKVKLPGFLAAQDRPDSYVQIEHVDHPPFPTGVPYSDAPFQVTWTIQHRGPAETLTVGIELQSFTGAGVIGEPKMEEIIRVGNDAEWQRYSTGSTYHVKAMLTLSGAYLVAYVRDQNGYTKASLQV